MRVYLHLVFFFSEFLLGNMFHGTSSYGLPNPSGTSLNPWVLAWAGPLALRRRPQQSKTVLSREAWGSTGSHLGRDTPASLFILSLGRVPPSLSLIPPQSYTQESPFRDLFLLLGPTAGDCGRSQVEQSPSAVI